MKCVQLCTNVSSKIDSESILQLKWHNHGQAPRDSLS
jgi:hypothetical protein